MNNFLNLRNPENLMLLNVIYHRGNRENGWKDSLDIIYRDLDTREKKLKHINNPTIPIYIVKEEFRDYNYNKNAIEMDKCDKVDVPYKDVLKYIANEAGGAYKEYYYNCIQTRSFSKMKNLHKWRYVFGSDLSIEQIYRALWFLNYDNPANQTRMSKQITRGFLDIEADTIDIKGFPKPGECPVNAVTVVDANNKVCYTLLFDNGENPLIPKFVKNIDKFIEKLHKNFDESYGVLDYKIFMYQSEKKLIEQLFALLNMISADFFFIWNMRFDIPYLIARYKELGGDPADIIPHPDFKDKDDMYFYEDKVTLKHKIDVANRGDYFHVSSYSYYGDDMIVYGGLRKGRATLRSNRLNEIGRVELEDEKLDFSEAANLKHLPYTDYELFVMYNIKDVLLQYGIDEKTGDASNLFIRAYLNGAEYHKVFKQTSLLDTRCYIEYYKQGLIIGNNANIEYGTPDESLFDDDDEDEDDDDDVRFSGALVADPRLNTDTAGMIINGVRSMFIFNNVIDLDFSSMYPNVIITFNIAPNCMIGKLIIEGFDKMPRFDYVEPESQTTKKKKNKKDEVTLKYDAGQDFLDNLMTGNYALLGATWFGLPEYDEIVDEFNKHFNIKNCKKYNVTVKELKEKVAI